MQIRPGGQTRTVGMIGQVRMVAGARPTAPRLTTLNQIQQFQQKVANNQPIDMNELDIVSIYINFSNLFFSNTRAGANASSTFFRIAIQM